MLTLKRFKALTGSYGARLERWPDEARAEAEALLRVSPEARQLLAEARELDEAIDAASDREDAVSWPPGEEEAAVSRLRARVAAGIAWASRDDEHRSDLARRDTATGETAAEADGGKGEVVRGTAGRKRRVGRGVEGGEPTVASAWTRWIRGWVLPLAQWSTPARVAGVAAASGSIIALGLLLGLMDVSHSAQPVDVLAMLQPDSLPFLADQ